MKQLVLLVISGLCLAFLAGCGPKSTDDENPTQRVDPAIAAVVNGEYILTSEVELEAVSQGEITVGEEITFEDPVFEEVLQQLIDQKLLAQEAISRGLDQSEVARHRLTATRERILGNILLEQLVDEHINDEVIETMYDAQIELKELGEEVLIRHIQVSTEAEADNLYDELMNGASFGELAFTHSTDRQTNEDEGLFPYAVPSSFLDPFPDMINRTAEGQISKPFESDYAWHIIKVEDRRDEKPPTLEDMRYQISDYLLRSEIGDLLLELRIRGDVKMVTDGSLKTSDPELAATVNGEYIQVYEVEFEAIAQNKLEKGGSLETDDELFDEILQQLIDQKLMAQEAMSRGLDQSERSRHRLHTMRENILGDVLIEELIAERVDETAIMEMYKRQSALQQLGEEVLIRHIQVETEDEANALYEELKAGAEFAELAFTHSVDTQTSYEGGLLTFSLPEEYAQPFPGIINRTAVGQFSKPFKSDAGWHIIKVEDRRKEEPTPLDEMRPKIVEFLMYSELSKALTELRARAEIRTHSDENPILAFQNSEFDEPEEASPDTTDAAETGSDGTEETEEGSE